MIGPTPAGQRPPAILTPGPSTGTSPGGLAANPASAVPGAPEREDPLMTAARALEASFLAEMLQAAGLGETRETFGGGAGEEAFGSLLARAQAEEMAQAGGIGLAESIYRSLAARGAGRPDGAPTSEAGR